MALQDKFIRDNLTEEDILVVDVGGNDVALHPTCGIIFNMALLLYLTPTCMIRCCPWLVPGMWYFIYMFRVRLRKITEKLIAQRKPKKIIICRLEFRTRVLQQGNLEPESFFSGCEWVEAPVWNERITLWKMFFRCANWFTRG